ncbi:MAG: formylglycine-generating enzyme family protein, partial [Planctomycetota bacterium]
YSTDFGKTWQLAAMQSLRGNGFDIVTRPGRKEIIWWGADQTGLADLSTVEIRVRGIAMARIAGGKFMRKTLPGAGRDEASDAEPSDEVPGFYMARHETTISMYADYLNEVGGDGAGWNARMANSDRCGIVKHENHTYSVQPGRGHYPVSYVSWYDATNFLRWCGLRLPTEAEWEKALRGGLYLDGDQAKKKANPLPERRYPWGDESPNAGGVFRCNFDGADDGFDYTAPVGAFAEFSSPYGICDLAGNMAEWTLDWYTTSHHAGLDGFRVARGGSWMAVPVACDAITQATQLPIKESSIMGFRGVKGPPPSE